MGRLDGKTCFVTGAAQGIGRDIVQIFLREGAAVVASDINQDRLNELPDTAGLQKAQLDVTDADAVRSAAQRFPEVSVLVNCAGYVATGTILNCSSEQFDRSFEIDVQHDLSFSAWHG